MLRTHNCGELTKNDAGQKATLSGWVDNIKLRSKLGFVNLRDRYGITQVFLNQALCDKLKDVKREAVLQVKGIIKARPEANPKLKTGEIELVAEEVEILNNSEPLPLELEGVENTEETRLKYRYLDLRTQKMQKNLQIRHKLTKAVRDYLDQNNFLEIETPILGKSTPEGARDYLVPSRLQKGKFYALPQSPQLFKQLCMVGGLDRYFQIAKCFRDEDLRQDRQPEFTQVDIEMSFIDQEDIINLIEGMIKYTLKEVRGVDVKTPFQRITYDEAIKKYKSDKPDLRENKDDKNEFAFCWVVDFPLLEWNEEEKRFYAMHHPFTSPKDEDLELLEKSPAKVRAKAYDIVLNGLELGGGSIRIHRRDVQERMFKALGISKEEAEQKFGFLLSAFKYGAPPHGGLAIGLDRFSALLAGEDAIRDVIAFPKNKDAIDIMLDSPSEVSSDQLNILGIEAKKK